MSKREIGLHVMVAAAAATVIAGLIYGARMVNYAATIVSVQEPEPGIHCALATSTDGVAIDCWRIDGE